MPEVACCASQLLQGAPTWDKSQHQRRKRGRRSYVFLYLNSNFGHYTGLSCLSHQIPRARSRCLPLLVGLALSVSFAPDTSHFTALFPQQQLKEDPSGDGSRGDGHERLLSKELLEQLQAQLVCCECWKLMGFRRQLENFTKRNAFRVANHKKSTSKSANPRGAKWWGKQLGKPSPCSSCSQPPAAGLPAPSPRCFSCSRGELYPSQFLRNQSCPQ